MPELFRVRPLPPPPPAPPIELPTVLILNRAGTTLAAESRASNVITHAATTMNPATEEKDWKGTFPIPSFNEFAF